MVAPKKVTTRERQENAKITDNIVKIVKSSAKEQKGNNVVEVNVKVYQVGHGFRPFGNHLPNDYIDYSIDVEGGKYKVDGLGKQDVALIGSALKIMLEKYFVVEMGGLYDAGYFTPYLEFPTVFRKFSTPTKEFKQLAKLVQKKYGIELKIDTLYRQYYGETHFTAYNSQMCQQYIDRIMSYGSRNTKCEICEDMHGTELITSVK